MKWFPTGSWEDEFSVSKPCLLRGRRKGDPDTKSGLGNNEAFVENAYFRSGNLWRGGRVCDLVTLGLKSEI